MAEEIITSTNAETATDHEYNASEIQVLKGLEAVRKRPGMYIGSTGERGLHHLVYEIVDNAIDEALAGYCDHIEVKILKDNIIQVTDNGRGIPVDIQADTGLPAVTVVYTILHAGGKFGGENSGYKVAGGLHGVGASVVNACSEWLTVNVRRDGHEYEQTFRRGDPDGPLKCIGTVADGVTGTRVTFKPDPEMFRDTTVYDFDTLEKRLREESFLNAGVKITLTDEREMYTPVLEDGKEGEPCYRTEVMCYEGGIKSFVTYLGEKRKLDVLHHDHLYSNVFSLLNYKIQRDVQVVMADEQEILLLLQEDESLIFKPFIPENIEALSLLPLTDCNEVTLQGVQWNLEYAPLLSAHPYAISNMVEQEKVVFTCNQGRVGFYLKYKL